MIYMDMLEKAALQGAITSAVSYLCNPNIRALGIPMLSSKPLPFWAVMAGTGVAASFVADGVHFFIKEEIHLKNKALDEASMVVGSAISAASLYAVVYVLRPEAAATIGLGCIAASGAAAEIGASFLLNMIKGD